MKYSTFLLILVGYATLSGCNQTTEFEYQVLKGATVFDGTGQSIDNGIIVVKGSKIESIGDKNTQIPHNSQIYDLTGKYVTPGFIDTHIHISSSAFWDFHAPPIFLSDSIPLSEVVPISRYQYERYFEAYLRSGVTAVYNVGGASWTLDLQRNNLNNPNSPHYFATGQIINAWYDWPEYDPVFIKPKDVNQGREVIEWLTSLGATGIKIYELNLEDKGHLNVIQAITKEVKARNNWIVAHAMNLDGAKKIVRMGAKVLVHSVVDKPVDEEFIQLLKENDVIYTPNLIVHEGYRKARKALLGETIPLDDPNHVLDQRTIRIWNNAHNYFSLLDSGFIEKAKEDNEYVDKLYEISYENLRKVYNSGVLISVGTDAGNPGTQHGISYVQELEMLEAAGIPSNEILVMATKNGALVMRKEETIGTLEPGKIADLVIMDNNPAEDISNVRTMTHVMHYGILRSVKQKSE